MTFTTLDENQHLNQPIHLLESGHSFSPASAAQPAPTLARPHSRVGLVWSRGTKGSGQGLVRWVLPGDLEQKGCI